MQILWTVTPLDEQELEELSKGVGVEVLGRTGDIAIRSANGSIVDKYTDLINWFRCLTKICTSDFVTIECDLIVEPDPIIAESANGKLDLFYGNQKITDVTVEEFVLAVRSSVREFVEFAIANSDPADRHIYEDLTIFSTIEK